ncbi:amylo-alpha-1,6-glucosidase [Miltoncostaea oceani]|uniref:amylo-alpha-1,6-glucosidase n=1 Tax=Miltoncostaea oceani TaxID=2843216 RepID=UPI001C3C84AD|nr:glycogen debranching N-terminal domain-containing protein [Miltoncostaea oceani]
MTGPAEPWTGPAAGGAVSSDPVTLVNGLSFALSDASGAMGDGASGLLVRDTRHLSRLETRVSGRRPTHLVAAVSSPTTARFHSYCNVEGLGPDAPLEIERRRTVSPDGMDESFVLRLWGAGRARLELMIDVDCDFADIFEVRRLRLGGDLARTAPPPTPAEEGLRFADPSLALETRVRFDPPPDRLDAGRASWDVELTGGETRTVRLRVRASGGRDELAEEPAGYPAPPASAGVRSDPPAFGRACRHGAADRATLAIPDALDPGRRLIAAGIPWFVALFGRDSLIAGHQARAFDLHGLRDTLHGLAARQGVRDDPENDEQPGKILHEVRLTRRDWLGSGTAGGERPYYGSVDATPLFLMMLGEARRWGLDRGSVEPLLPAARRALAWMRGPGDPDGDGLLEYAPLGARSLGNQAWKDSENAVQFPDGSLAEGPIAMVEVQGYAYRARVELARTLAWVGDDAAASDLLDEAARTRAAIRERYWVPGEGGTPGFFALALDGRKRPVPAATSNMGHLLWCDVPTPAQAAHVAAHIRGAALSSGWGLRTLSSDMAGFNPISYHAGSVWPHDTAIACEGLRRYGLHGAAVDLAGALIDAATAFDGRLPELFGGHRREPGDVPIPYPNACRPQAWAAGVPLALATTLLGLEPDIPDGRITIDPVLPANLRSLEVHGMTFPGGVLSVDVTHRGPRLASVPAGIAVELAARPTMGRRTTGDDLPWPPPRPSAADEPAGGVDGVERP